MLQQLPKRPRESLTIVDMRDFEISRPYYRGYTEIIFVLRGEGLVVVGTTPIKVGPGSVLRIPPDTAHFMVPKDLVLGVVTIGSGYEDGRTFLQESDPRVGFDRSRYEEFSAAI